VAISAFIPEYLDLHALKVNLTQYLFICTLGLQDIDTMDFEAHDHHIFRVTILDHFSSCPIRGPMANSTCAVP
jgi:hypothetical protein